jgi:hypothetical protein
MMMERLASLRLLGTASSGLHSPEMVTLVSNERAIETSIPDLRNIPLDELVKLGDSVLAHAIALYRERVKETGIPLSSFQARI